jgi:hypothetical protein
MEQKYYDSIDHQVFTNGKKDSKEGISYNSFGRCKEQETQDETSQPDTPNLQIPRWNAYPTLQQTYPLTISNFPKPCASARDFDIPCLLDVPLLHESVRFGGDPERKMHVDI